MADKIHADGEIVTGRVKWFDSIKGFGFVTCDTVSGDILLHANVLRNFGQSSVSDGSQIRMRIVETHRGHQATEILDVEAAPPEDHGHAEGDLPFDHSLEGGPLQPARVKWFDRAKGFGFANVFGDSEDVFIHIEVLRRSALADLQPGEAVAIRVAEGERGRLATQVSVWESAYSADGSSEPSSD
ncbi:cold shock domain-containing protein [Maribius pontilimi]|uniref:Cold shock domain-containing protein n=1 Tax=Palleronia pontilimi TaxID=1964209 RepID=A0A934I7P2_9RHOB|nr:cold shock domain-containing protein [Palleronia pontilimi]MBJ3761964.1 cold shock domain-containing protein [Palleronia pontilimi]